MSTPQTPNPKPRTLNPHMWLWQVRSADHTGRHEVVRLEVREFEAEAECSFEFRKQRFCWDAEDNGFHKLRCPTKVWLQHLADGHNTPYTCPSALSLSVVRCCARALGKPTGCDVQAGSAAMAPY